MHYSSTVLILNLKDVLLSNWRLNMLHSVSQTSAISPIKSSSQENNSISPWLKLIENKISAMNCDKRSIEINQFADFIKDNKSKILAFPVSDDRLSDLLVKSTGLLNEINDNNEISLDNTENYIELSNLKNESEELIRTNSQDKPVEQRINDEVKRSAEK